MQDKTAEENAIEAIDLLEPMRENVTSFMLKKLLKLILVFLLIQSMTMALVHKAWAEDPSEHHAESCFICVAVAGLQLGHTGQIEVDLPILSVTKVLYKQSDLYISPGVVQYFLNSGTPRAPPAMF